MKSRFWSGHCSIHHQDSNFVSVIAKYIFCDGSSRLPKNYCVSTGWIESKSFSSDYFDFNNVLILRNNVICCAHNWCYGGFSVFFIHADVDYCTSLNLPSLVNHRCLIWELQSICRRNVWYKLLLSGSENKVFPNQSATWLHNLDDVLSIDVLWFLLRYALTYRNIIYYWTNIQCN